MNRDDELPEGWVWTTVAEVTQDVPNIKPEDEPKRKFAYVDISSIDNQTHTITSTRALLGKDAPSRARRPVRYGDVLFSNVRTYLRNVAMVSDGIAADVCSTGFTVLRANAAVDPEFLFRYTLTDEFVRLTEETSTGTHYPATSDRAVMELPIPLPPVAEQRRIVTAVERLLGRVSAARDRLNRVPATLKRFRQAVLAAACSGRLTVDWREDGLNDSDLPSGWIEAEAGSFYVDARYGTSTKCDREPDGVPVLRVPNIAKGVLDLADLKYGPLTAREVEALKLERGDIVVCRTNGSLDLIGKAAVVPHLDRPHAFASYLIRLRLDESKLLPDFFHAFLSGPSGRDQIEDDARTTAGQFNLNLDILRSLRLLLPPLPEQREIVRRVGDLFAKADAIEAKLAAARRGVEGLTQAVLAQAFCGELVPTEAELARRDGRPYEPASALLDRIQAERAKDSAPKRRTSRRS